MSCVCMHLFALRVFFFCEYKKTFLSSASKTVFQMPACTHTRIHTHKYHIEDPSRQPRLLMCNDGEVECGVGGELTWLEHNGAASGQRLATILKSQCPSILCI